jgi:hypothetical protein
MLRSYDPQIGRFLQNDPYDQFSSGYVGMGNDPGNGVDPSGGFFGGPIGGCAAAAGMVGYGGMASIGSISNTLSTVVAISSIAMKGAGVVSNMSATSSLSSPASSSSSVYNSGGGAPSTGNYDDEGGDNPCNCPPGFSSTPPSSNTLPVFLNIDLSKPPFNNPFYTSEYDVVKYYSLMVKDVAGAEYSGLIYYLNAKLKNGTTVKMYSITGFETIDGDILHSPGPGQIKHPLPKGAVPVAHIHNHWRGLESHNSTFSGYLLRSPKGGDYANLLGPDYRWNNINYWVLGSTGYLSKYFADNTPPPKNSGNAGDAGQIFEYKQGDNFYSNPPSFPPCPCFKIKN